jgi:hypothetical protein
MDFDTDTVYNASLDYFKIYFFDFIYFSRNFAIQKAPKKYTILEHTFYSILIFE